MTILASGLTSVNPRATSTHLWTEGQERTRQSYRVERFKTKAAAREEDDSSIGKRVWVRRTFLGREWERVTKITKREFDAVAREARKNHRGVSLIV